MSVCPRYYLGTPNSSFDPAPSRIVAICHKAGRNIEAREDPLLLTHRHPHPRTSLHPSIPPTPEPPLRFHHRCKRAPAASYSPEFQSPRELQGELP
ncbi:hypothetical protein FQA47_012552 [Oryzias melastigma]|uniref:Uncharacterized protein n=1 Tax=Oryzias melastigma TaxID=30732 RepID=A0A834BYP4_ORYME|nr:hypothetical protein FQA47_012552 [Oryzias melastigma]